MYPFFVACCGLSFRASFAFFFRICGLAKFVCICNAELNYCFPSSGRGTSGHVLLLRQETHLSAAVPATAAAAAVAVSPCSVLLFCAPQQHYRRVFGLLFERRPETRNLCHQLVPRVLGAAGEGSWVMGHGRWEMSPSGVQDVVTGKRSHLLNASRTRGR